MEMASSECTCLLCRGRKSLGYQDKTEPDSLDGTWTLYTFPCFLCLGKGTVSAVLNEAFASIHSIRPGLIAICSHVATIALGLFIIWKGYNFLFDKGFEILAFVFSVLIIALGVNVFVLFWTHKEISDYDEAWIARQQVGLSCEDLPPLGWRVLPPRRVIVEASKKLGPGREMPIVKILTRSCRPSATD